MYSLVRYVSQDLLCVMRQDEEADILIFRTCWYAGMVR